MATFDTRPPRRTSKEKLAPGVFQEATDWYDRACAFHERGELEQAVSAYTEVIRRIPDFYQALDNRGLCLMRLGRFAEAIPGLEQSAQVNSESRLAFVSLIKCYRASKQSVKGMHLAQHCLAKWPDQSPFDETEAG